MSFGMNAGLKDIEIHLLLQEINFVAGHNLWLYLQTTIAK